MKEIFEDVISRDYYYKHYKCILNPNDIEPLLTFPTSWKDHLDHARENGLLIVAYLYFNSDTGSSIRAIYSDGKYYPLSVNTILLEDLLRKKYRFGSYPNYQYTSYKLF